MYSEAILKYVTKRARRQSAYRHLGDTIDNPDGECIFIDRGASILAVGHLDTVLWSKPKVSNDRIARCPQLDDRLGVAIILELLGDIISEPIDVLLTDCEEQGNSTASHFVAPRQYRWCVEFDRNGSDCVLYDYGDDTLQESIEQCGIDVGWGSYSDIADLDIGCQCVNWGCGYHGQHTMSCYANFAEIDSQLRKFACWYQWHGQADYPYVPRPKARKTRYTSAYGWWTDATTRSVTPRDSAWVECIDCGCRKNLLSDDFCIECGSDLIISRNA